MANIEALNARAAGGTEQRRESLVGSEGLLCAVRVEDCVFESGDLQSALDGSPQPLTISLYVPVPVLPVPVPGLRIGYSRRL